MKFVYLFLIVLHLIEGTLYATGILDMTRVSASINAYLIAIWILVAYQHLDKK